MIFFACGEGPFGRRPHYPNDPVDLPARAFYTLPDFSGRSQICLFVWWADCSCMAGGSCPIIFFKI